MHFRISATVYFMLNRPISSVHAVIGCLLVVSGIAKAQQMSVTIVNRRSSDTGYSYVVPAHWSSNTSGTATCAGGSSINCAASSTTTGYSTGPRQISYSVQGATLSLELPDGRLAVVNCASKYKMRGDYINRRSCRIPLVDEIQAEFKGKKVKLQWLVSLDGKKSESETYTMLAVLGKK